MRAVVTGGAGFIGSHLVDALVARGDEVTVIDDLSTGRHEQVNEGATLVVHDVREPFEIEADVVFHLAAQADVGTSMERPGFDTAVNVLGTVNALEAARAAGAALVFTSTGGAIYGEVDRPVAEDAERRPVSAYGIAKLSAETYVDGWNRIHGSRHVVLRLANVYGPRQSAELEGGVVAIFMERLARGEETLGVEAEARHVEARPGDARRNVLDVTRAVRELGWRPQVTLAEGLRRTWKSLAG